MNPLTKEQAAFAADHHRLIYAFLRDRGYHPDEYYDICVFGYLSAVQQYMEREELRQYAFSTIAYRAMSRVVWNHFRSHNCKMRRANIVPYEEEIHVSESRYSDISNPEAQLLSTEGADAILRTVTPTQSKIIYMRAEGYSNQEIGKSLNMQTKTVEQELDSTGVAVYRLMQAAA